MRKQVRNPKLSNLRERFADDYRTNGAADR